MAGRVQTRTSELPAPRPPGPEIPTAAWLTGPGHWAPARGRRGRVRCPEEPGALCPWLAARLSAPPEPPKQSRPGGWDPAWPGPGRLRGGSPCRPGGLGAEVESSSRLRDLSKKSEEGQTLSLGSC